MITELKVDGMSCGHCVRSVKEALEELDGVTSASVSLEDGKAVVDHDGSDEAALVAAVEAEGYRAKVV